MKKQVIFTFIVCILLCSLIVPVGATYFSDVSAGYWARDAINYVADRGYMGAKTGTSFSPTSNMTRADVAKLIYKYAGSPSVSGSVSFQDVEGLDCYNAVVWLYSNGIMNGSSSSTFSPSWAIQRQDMAVVLYRYADYSGFDVTATANISQYTDSSNISDYALTAVKWAVAEGIMSGKTTTTLAPLDSVDRQTAATVIMRFGFLVEGVRFGRDNFGFTNNGSIFTESNYYLTNEHKALLFQYLSQESNLNSVYEIQFINGQSNSVSLREKFENEIAKPWTGSCYGMSVSVILNMLGQLDYVGNFGSAYKNDLYDFAIDAASNDELKSAINYHQISQLLPEIVNQRIQTQRNKINDGYTGWKTWWYNIPNLIDENGFVLLSIRYYKENATDPSCHAVVAYDYTMLSTGMKIHIYDPNKLTSDYLLISNTNEEEPGFPENEYGKVPTVAVRYRYSMNKNPVFVYMVDYISGFQSAESVYRSYDLDSSYNNFSTNQTSSYDSLLTQSQNKNEISTTTRENISKLSLDLSENFEITNNEGKKLIYSNGVFSGDMEIIFEYLDYGDCVKHITVITTYSDNFYYKILK